MRRLPATALLCAALALAACGNPCQDLGDRICTCVGGGTARDACKAAVKRQLADANMNSSDKTFCAGKLDTCNVPSQPEGVVFCEWINTSCGKASCGLSNDTPAQVCAATP
jgi:hypothetical protein